MLNYIAIFPNRLYKKLEVHTMLVFAWEVTYLDLLALAFLEKAKLHSVWSMCPQTVL